MRNERALIGIRSLLLLAVVAWPFTGAWAGTPQEQVLYRFAGGSDGAQPNNGLIADSAGNLYGTTSEGGGAGCGGIGCGIAFELSPQQGGGWTETILHIFKGGKDGAVPDAPLVADAAGNLYGTTSEGGSDTCGLASGCGAVFELSPRKRGWKEKILYSFDAKSKSDRNANIQPPELVISDVWAPNGLVFGSDGNLYGFAFLGGRCDVMGFLVACYGGAFELKKPSKRDAQWRESVIYRAKNLLTGRPEGPPVFDTSGNLYGLEVGANYGSVFALQPPADKGKWRPSTLYTFQGGDDGGYLAPGLAFDANGNLYGATTGYQSLPGNVFELTPGKNGAWTETPLYTFANAANGNSPTAAPVLGGDGNIYGMTSAGGQSNLGVVYELSPQNGSWNETVLYSFSGGSEGATPQGTLLASSGTFYGVTLAGGNGGCYNNAGCGTVFALIP